MSNTADSQFCAQKIYNRVFYLLKYKKNKVYKLKGKKISESFKELEILRHMHSNICSENIKLIYYIRISYTHKSRITYVYTIVYRLNSQ